MLTCFLLRKILNSIRASFRKELPRVRGSSIIIAAATCFDELILDTEMYEQSSESAHACVVKYIRARLPSQARRAGLASRLVRVWAPLNPLYSWERFPDRSEWKEGSQSDRKGGLIWYTNGSKTNKGTGAGVYGYGYF
jgi:hypothetical protein